MPFDDLASIDLASIDFSDSGGTYGDTSELQDDESPFLFSPDSEDPGQNSDAEVVGNRPQRSPYASDIVALKFSPSQTLRIPRQFLEKTPLAARLARCEPPNEMDLGSIQFDAGHVIVNFLVTGRYQCLEPWGITAAGKYSSEFRTALRVYMAAESLGLAELFNVAQEEVQKAGDKLSFPQVVDNVHFLDPFHAHFPWIGEYVQSRMVSFWESTTVEEATEMTSDVLGPSNLHKILISGLLKMKASSTWPEGHESAISDAKTPEDRVEEELVAPHSQIVERLKISNENVLELAAELKKMGVLQERSGSSSSPKQQDEPRLQMPEVTLVQETPELPPKKSVEEIEQEAVLEQCELRSLMSLDSGLGSLGLSWAEQKRLSLLEQKSHRRAYVLNAKRDWDQINLQEEKAVAPFKGINIHETFREILRDSSSSLTKLIFFRALLKKYHSEKLEVMARRKAAVERYQSPMEPEDPNQGGYSESVSSESNSCSSLSTGQRTPESGSVWNPTEMCLELESHLSGGGWRGCGLCLVLVFKALQDMTTPPELEVSED